MVDGPAAWAPTKGTTNLGRAGFLRDSAPGSSLFSVAEQQEGADLNGDGDTADQVPYVYRHEAGDVLDVGLAFDPLGEWFALARTHLAVAVQEREQGGTDRNGDGDADDAVVAVVRLDTGAVTNLGLGGVGGLAHDLRLRNSTEVTAFRASERHNGGVDLNADGDINDWVLHLYDLDAGELVNAAVAVGVRAVPAVHGRIVAFGVSELLQGRTDLNGDGDDRDEEAFSATLAAAADTTPPDVTAELLPVGRVGPRFGRFAVGFACTDDEGGATVVAAVNDTPVSDGEVVWLLRHRRTTVQRLGNGHLLFEAPAFELQATCTDEAGNVGTATTSPAFRARRR